LKIGAGRGYTAYLGGAVTPDMTDTNWMKPAMGRYKCNSGGPFRSHQNRQNSSDFTK